MQSMHILICCIQTADVLMYNVREINKAYDILTRIVVNNV